VEALRNPGYDTQMRVALKEQKTRSERMGTNRFSILSKMAIAGMWMALCRSFRALRILILCTQGSAKPPHLG
jgi:hypothetical protein